MTTILSPSNRKLPTPRVSIVMPTYNRAGSFLQQAIESVLKQSFSDFELIVVDDASTDNTEGQIAQFNDQRLIYQKLNSHRGEYWTTNFAVDLSRGIYLTWLHSDDLLPKDSLAQRVAALEGSGDLDFVHGDIIKIDSTGHEISWLKATSQNSPKVFAAYLANLAKGKMVYLVHHTTIMMKRDFFYKVGPLDEQLPFAGDIDWLIRALRLGKYQRIPQILYLYRVHPETRRVTDIKQGINKEEVHKLIASRYL